MAPDATTTTKKKTRKKTTTKKAGTKKTTKKKTSKAPASSSEGPGQAPTQMLVNYVPGGECRVAFVSDGLLEEFDAERPSTATSVGNIYLGTVTNVESAIQAAFVDFGHESNGFLHISDLHPQYFPGEDEDTTERIGHKTPRRERPPIQKCLKKGQKVLVQVIKEGIGTKGPTVTGYLSIPGRYLVMLPQMDKVGVSRKIEDDDLRKKGRQILDTLELPPEFGFILRTAGLDQTKTELKRDLSYLKRLWTDIERRLKKANAKRQKPGDMAGRLLFAESDLLMRVLRDRWAADVTEIIIDHPMALKRAARFMKIVAPRSATKLLHYDMQTPIFHAFGLEEQIQRMHEREVPLPNGGSLVIDETEAMIAIDVNSGKMRKHGDSETTAFETNKQAVDEICRQMRLRDIGGLVVCDLIDMMKRSNRREIEKRLNDRLKRDRASAKALPISQFGMIEMTRQRQRGSLRSQHFTKCPSCGGRGLVRRPASVAADVLRDIAALLDHDRIDTVEIVVAPRVAGELLSTGRLRLTQLEHRTGKTVQVRVSEEIQADRVVFYAYDEQGADVALEKLPRPKKPTKLPEWTDTGSEDDALGDDTVETLEIDLEAMEERHAEEDAMLEAMPDIDGDEEASQAPANDDEEGAGKKRRRRRRGRRRGRRREESEEGAERAETDTDEPSAHEDEDERERARVEHEPARDEDEESADGESGRKRRRRRRRRGGRGREDDEASALDDRDDAAEDDGVEIAPADTSDRGDSWDMTPEEFDAAYPRPNRRVREEQPRRKKKRRSRSEQAESDPAQPEASTPDEEAAPEEAVASTADEQSAIDPINGTTMIKKKRTRKAPAKRAPAKAAAVENGDDASAPVVKRRSLFGSRRTRS